MLHVEPRGESVRLLRIDRQHRRNAVDHATLQAIGDALAEAVADRVRVVVLTGDGGHFSAGADLGGIEGDGFAAALGRALRSLRDSPVLTIAAVDGSCFGAGVQLAASCDLRVVGDSARIGVPAGQRGIAVDQWTVALLVELLGGAAARAMLLACEVLDAEAAVRVGLATRRGTVDDALAWADELARLAPLSLVAHKAALTRVSAQLRGDDDPAVRAAFAAAWASADAAEGRAAFAAKRPAVFRGE